MFCSPQVLLQPLVREGGKRISQPQNLRRTVCFRTSFAGSAHRRRTTPTGPAGPLRIRGIRRCRGISTSRVAVGQRTAQNGNAAANPNTAIVSVQSANRTRGKEKKVANPAQSAHGGLVICIAAGTIRGDIVITNSLHPLEPGSRHGAVLNYQWGMAAHRVCGPWGLAVQRTKRPASIDFAGPLPLI
jgi:hypothetical protein